MKIENIRVEVLKKLGTVPNKFITKNTVNNVVIEEKGENATLQKVIIHNIPNNFDVWLLDFELPISGFTPKSKTVEKVIVTLIDNNLTFYMIELKSSIKHYLPQERKPSSLNQIHGKFEESISRILFLLTFDNHHDWNKFKELQVKFKGIVFYNKRIQSEKDEETRLCQIINSSKKAGLIECASTFLGSNKIEVKFIQNSVDKSVLDVEFNNIIC